MTHRRATGTLVRSFAYTFDNAGNRTRVVENTGDIVTYSYNNEYMLTAEKRTGSGAYDLTYGYDQIGPPTVGNRITRLDGLTGGNSRLYGFDSANRAWATGVARRRAVARINTARTCCTKRATTARTKKPTRWSRWFTATW